jgi:hypothetical protein
MELFDDIGPTVVRIGGRYIENGWDSRSQTLGARMSLCPRKVKPLFARDSAQP